MVIKKYVFFIFINFNVNKTINKIQKTHTKKYQKNPFSKNTFKILISLFTLHSSDVHRG